MKQFTERGTDQQNIPSQILPKSQLIALLDDIVDQILLEQFGPPLSPLACPHCHESLSTMPVEAVHERQDSPRKNSQELITDLRLLLGQPESCSGPLFVSPES